MTSRDPHPAPTTLEAFALGRLGTAEMDSVASHLGGCPSCGRRVLQAPDDPIIRLLRRAPTPDPPTRPDPTTRVATPEEDGPR